MLRPSHRVPDLPWQAWGAAAGEVSLPHEVTALLEQALHIRPAAAGALVEEDVRMPASALPAAAREALSRAVGVEHILADRHARLLHAGGKSTVDLLRRRAGDALDAPDAVVLPATHEEVLDVLRCCAQHRVAVVPFGGGTSVVGGVAPSRGQLSAVIALDLRRMDGIVEIDHESATVTLEPGLKGPEAADLLAAHGLTLGHFPQSFEHATIGGFAATRSAGQASAGYGRFDDLVVALRVATPEGTLRLGRAPASATGPDLRELFIGSEGILGVITELTLRVRPAPQTLLDEAWRFPDFAAGSHALRRLAQADALPTVLRLSDEVETAVSRALGGDAALGLAEPGGTFAITCYEGDAERLLPHRETVRAILADAGGSSLGESAGQAWRRGRFDAPYLRDALLAAGALVETLETATSWSRLPALYAGVRDAVTAELARQGTPPLVMCHISHVYATGASLYFTVVAAAATDPVDQWKLAKGAAGDAIAARGGTISHHHGVGTDHRRWMAAEVGELGIAVLRAVKSVVDPCGILNPDKLLPPTP
jgi:alkyldihydroxyacetonephosphate synthase